MAANAKQQDDRVKGHCPTCGADRWADVAGAHKHDYNIDSACISGTIVHRILVCRGCEDVYFQRYEECSENIVEVPDGNDGWTFEIEPKIQHWPAPTVRERPEWIFSSDLDVDLNRLLGEVYEALDAELRVLAAIGIRTAFDRASELLGVDPSRTFAQKLDDLHGSGKIGTDEKDTLTVLTDAGSAAAHRGWRPSNPELSTMMNVLETFVYRSFVLGGMAQKLKGKVPPKPPRKLNSSQSPASLKNSS